MSAVKILPNGKNIIGWHRCQHTHCPNKLEQHRAFKILSILKTQYVIHLFVCLLSRKKIIAVVHRKRRSSGLEVTVFRGGNWEEKGGSFP